LLSKDASVVTFNSEAVTIELIKRLKKQLFVSGNLRIGFREHFLRMMRFGREPIVMAGPAPIIHPGRLTLI
jgi:hypothetical protein